ncbi:MAG: DNA-binding response regulator, partial [Clostridium perfringens]|nr:DNA-binding response regulator [Clostridium perfringens]
YFTEDVEKSLNDTLELNSMFRQPLSEKEVRRATKSAETVFKNQNKDYKYKNETLINLLEILDVEQREMKTIISKKEYKRRNNEYNKNKYYEKLKKDGKITKEEQMSQRRRKIRDLLAKGLKQKDICLTLNISKDTYLRDRKYLKEQG